MPVETALNPSRLSSAVVLSAGTRGVKSKTDYACRTRAVGLADASSILATSTNKQESHHEGGFLVCAVDAKSELA